MSTFDKNWVVIVIGSGLRGLSAAAHPARTGQRVLVLELSPVFDHLPGLLQPHEPVLVETLVAKLPVERLHEAVAGEH